jgi:superfamily II DNA helicase RecQ
MPTRSYVSQGDKVETSPSGAAKCQRCREKIQKGSKRVGKELYLAKWNTYSHTYYHVECFKKTFPGQEPNLPGRRSLEMALDREAKQEATSRKLLDERRPLWEELRQLRLAFARRLDVSAFIVFENTVLDELVLHMPTTKNDILNIKGIKEKRYQSFGEPILEVIRDYLRRTNPPSSNGAAPAVEDQDEEDQAEEGVQIEGSLSCDEIVARKFEHATANGYMISV